MKRYYILTLLIALLSYSCSEENLDGSIIKDPTIVPSEIDNWISGNFTSKFNIEIVYKWDDEESDITKNLVPPREDAVMPFLSVLKTLWIDTYTQEADENFIKLLAPKQMFLVGSQSYNGDGTITEGTAEGGRKIILYGVNDFDSHSKRAITHMIHVVHHEFAHIMHQTVDYGVEFGKITPSGYTSTWNTIPENIARNSGFITPYAQMNTDEDFVEMISNFLINSHEEWEAILAGIKDPKGVELIRKKEAIMADYLLDKWDIDIYHFQKLVSDEIAKLVESN